MFRVRVENTSLKHGGRRERNDCRKGHRQKTCRAMKHDHQYTRICSTENRSHFRGARQEFAVEMASHNFFQAERSKRQADATFITTNPRPW